MKALVLLLIVGVVVPALLLAGGLLANRVPLLAEPGLGERLRTYLTTNVAETSPQPRFPELAEPVFPVPTGRLYEAVGAAMDDLGWERHSEPKAVIHRAVVTTRLWRFRDDVTVRVEAAGEGASRLAVHAASRVGRGDLGANTRHVLDLVDAVARSLGSRPGAG